VSDLWGDFTDPVREAARRYEADAVLTGRVSEAGPRLWRGRWTLIQGGEIERWSADSGDLGALLSEGLNRAADMLAGRFAPRTASAGTEQVELRVRGVDSFADYARLRRHLESLELVTALELRAAGPETLTLLLGVRGADATVAQSLGLGGVLVPVATAGPAGSGPAPRSAAGVPVLEYRLSP
jgi:hypothetical protein